PRGTPGVHVRSAGDGTADDQFANGANQAGLIRFTGRTQDGLEPAKTPSLIQFSIRNALRALPTCPEMARWMPGTRRRRARDRGTRATPVREQGVDWNRSDVFHMNFSGWLLPAAEGLSKRYDEAVTAMAEVQVQNSIPTERGCVRQRNGCHTYPWVATAKGGATDCFLPGSASTRGPGSASGSPRHERRSGRGTPSPPSADCCREQQGRWLSQAAQEDHPLTQHAAPRRTPIFAVASARVGEAI